MSQGDHLEELRRQYAALGFTEGSPATVATPSLGSTAGAEASGLDELQRQYAAMGFSEAQTPVRSAEGSARPNATQELPRMQESLQNTTNLEDLQQRYADIFQDNPTADQQVRAHTPESSSASTGAATHIHGTVGGIDEFAMYQRFRLHMVQIFGSLAAALFELGADPEAGKISRDDFVQVLADRMHLYSHAEANTLFSHATNADVMDHDQGGFATFRDFGISENEWRMTVSAKLSQQTGENKEMPFQSGPKGSSMGIFHRNITLNEVLGEDSSRPSSKAKAKASATAQNDGAAADASADPGTPSATRRQLLNSSQGRKPMSRSARNSNGERVWPWRQTQQKWKPSMFAGEGFLQEVRAHKPHGRTRDNEYTFACRPRAPIDEDDTRPPQLGTGDCQRVQAQQEQHHPLGVTPIRREEMEPKACVRQVKIWWPYKSQAPAPKLPILPPVVETPTKKAATPRQSSKTAK